MTSWPKSQIIDLLKKIAIIAKIARIVKIAIYAVPSTLNLSKTTRAYSNIVETSTTQNMKIA